MGKKCSTPGKDSSPSPALFFVCPFLSRDTIQASLSMDILPIVTDLSHMKTREFYEESCKLAVGAQDKIIRSFIGKSKNTIEDEHKAFYAQACDLATAKAREFELLVRGELRKRASSVYPGMVPPWIMPPMPPPPLNFFQWALPNSLTYPWPYPPTASDSKGWEGKKKGQKGAMAANASDTNKGKKDNKAEKSKGEAKVRFDDTSSRDLTNKYHPPKSLKKKGKDGKKSGNDSASSSDESSCSSDGSDSDDDDGGKRTNKAKSAVASKAQSKKQNNQNEGGGKQKPKGKCDDQQKLGKKDEKKASGKPSSPPPVSPYMQSFYQPGPSLSYHHGYARWDCRPNDSSRYQIWVPPSRTASSPGGDAKKGKSEKSGKETKDKKLKKPPPPPPSRDSDSDSEELQRNQPPQQQWMYWGLNGWESGAYRHYP